MSVGFFVTEKKTLDEGRVLKFEMGTHFLHVNDRLVFVKFEGDGELLEKFQALLTVRDG